MFTILLGAGFSPRFLWQSFQDHTDQDRLLWVEADYQGDWQGDSWSESYVGRRTAVFEFGHPWSHQRYDQRLPAPCAGRHLRRKSWWGESASSVAESSLEPCKVTKGFAVNWCGMYSVTSLTHTSHQRCALWCYPLQPDTLSCMIQTPITLFRMPGIWFSIQHRFSRPVVIVF